MQAENTHLQNMFQEILAVASLLLTCHTFAQSFEAILSNTRLPVPLYSMSVVYDGVDSIYVLGGLRADENYQEDILKFDVTAETIRKIGTMDPVASGSAVWTGDEILYFGGYNGSQLLAKVWSHKQGGASDWTQVGELPRSASSTSSVWGHGDHSYVFGGHAGTGNELKTITRYSSVTNVSVVVGELPGSRRGTSAGWDETTGDAYVFGGYNSVGLNDIVRFNPAKETVVTLNVSLPLRTYFSCAIWTGIDAYIIGGAVQYGQMTNISRFNPSTNEVRGVPVKNLPANLFGHSCAFVSKLNRIYVFGGGISGSNPRDEILYIDLDPSPTTPTTTTATTTQEPVSSTTNKVVGTGFPDPYCYLLALIVCFHLQ